MTPTPARLGRQYHGGRRRCLGRPTPRPAGRGIETSSTDPSSDLGDARTGDPAQAGQRPGTRTLRSGRESTTTIGSPARHSSQCIHTMVSPDKAPTSECNTRWPLLVRHGGAGGPGPGRGLRARGSRQLRRCGHRNGGAGIGRLDCPASRPAASRAPGGATPTRRHFWAARRHVRGLVRHRRSPERRTHQARRPDAGVGPGQRAAAPGFAGPARVVGRVDGRHRLDTGRPPSQRHTRRRRPHLVPGAMGTRAAPFR